MVNRIREALLEQKIDFFSIYTVDTGLILIDDHRSMGPERRKVLDHAILEGTKTYRDALQEMWNSVHISWDEAWTEYLDRT